jgi:beta-lactam-binding protein with PASTA domain
MPALPNSPSESNDLVQSTSVTLPDLVGLNAQVAEEQLKRIGLRDVMSSANPEYKMVLVAKNWQVVSQEPAAGCAVSQGAEVDLDVTKP